MSEEVKFEPLDHDLTLRKLRELRDSLSEPHEMFPWREHAGCLDGIVDAEGKAVAAVFGYCGGRSPNSLGVAERRRLILEAPAMLEVVCRVARMPDALGIKEGAQAILDRIEGKQET